ncbi:alpha/beta hydrolase [Burkholderia sp. 22PA0099]|uniref:alpha/beta hydrolase n=1 Tax=Burkholderia sp. 22PA0099 TaxID=3237372 RepID=UPI0039C35D9D
MRLQRTLIYAWPLMLAAMSAVAAQADTPAAAPVMRERDVVYSPVPIVQPERLELATPSGTVQVPIAVSRDWTRPQPDVTRAVIVIPGWPRRDLTSGEHAARLAGPAARDAMLITPQFLTAKDIAAHHLPDTMLRWRESGWPHARLSTGPVAISSFEVVDEIFKRLANRALFPNLRLIVLAGHSAGGQYVQRYAALGRGEADLGGEPIAIRYVVANPATYLYFTDVRPDRNGAFAPFDAKRCPTFERWNYGLRTGVPPYAGAPATAEAAQARYLQRDVVYLLGTADNSPDEDSVGHSCEADAQGLTRFDRGRAYDAYIHMLDPQTRQHVIEARGVAHSSWRIYASACGMAALFDKPGCSDAVLERR